MGKVNKIVQKAFAVVTVLALVLTSIMGVSKVEASTYQSQLDNDGFTTFSNTDRTLTLRKNTTYFIGLSGGAGGSGGRGLMYYFDDDEQRGTAYGYGDSGAVWTEYYTVTVGSSDVSISVRFGSSGGSGSNAGYVGWQGPGATGGSGGSNASGFSGSGNKGNDGQVRGNGDAGWNTSGAGGGGGGASAIVFNNDTSQRLTARGGSGGRGGAIVSGKNISYYGNNYKIGDVILSGSSGGSGGSISNSTSITGVTFRTATSAESVAVQITSGREFKIARKMEIGSEGVEYTKLPVGSHFMLPSTAPGEAGIFQKVDNTTCKFVTGSGGGAWYRYSDYLTGQLNSNLTVKTGLVFIDGEGTTDRPYYVQPPPSSSGSGGGSSVDITPELESIFGILSLSVDKMNEQNILLAQQTQVMQEQTNAINLQASLSQQTLENSDFSFSIKTLTGLSATSSSSVDVLIKLQGRNKNNCQIRSKLNNGSWSAWQPIPDTDILSASGLSLGYNTITVQVQDIEYGTTQTESLGVLDYK